MSKLQKWTQSTVWYLFQPIMENFGIEVNRDTITGYIPRLCKAAGVTREALGIFAGARAELYFDGVWSSVSFGKISKLAEKGTDIVCIEKQGVPEVLTEWADTYGIALLNSRGHLTEYGKDLLEAARRSGAMVVVIVDFDLPGIKIASETPPDMPWIGVNFRMLEYFHLTKEEVSIPAKSDQYENYVTDLVEKGKHPSDAKNDNAGEFDDRFEDVDLGFLKDRRIEIDAILAKVGSERFFEFIKHELKRISATRNYNRAIDISTEFYNKDIAEFLPDPIRRFLERTQAISNAAAAKKKREIKSQLEKVEGFLEVEPKKKEIVKQLTEALAEDEDIKVLSSACEELMRSGILPEVNKNDDYDHDDADESS